MQTVVIICILDQRARITVFTDEFLNYISVSVYKRDNGILRKSVYELGRKQQMKPFLLVIAVF